LDDLTEAIRLDRNNREAYALRAVENAHAGNGAAAQQDLEQAVGLGYDQALLAKTIQRIRARR
jgi:Tfp pilus assembly protein PilF